MFILTCLTNQPDIFFLSFGKAEDTVRFGDVDSNKNHAIVCPKKPSMNFEKTGNQVSQILGGSNTEGFRFATVAQGQSKTPSIEIWGFQ